MKRAKAPQTQRVCKLHESCCCDKPAPRSYHTLAHERGENTADMHYETEWWFECWSCGYICACEV